MTIQHQILVGLGGNLASPVGSPRNTLLEAVELLRNSGLEGIELSGLYETNPIPVSDQPNFLNCALRAQTAISAENLLSLFTETEKIFGREPGDRWSARTLDIDLLAYGNSVLPNRKIWDRLVCSESPSAYIENVTVPHPRLHKRAFVLLPLMDIAPDWMHSCLMKSVSEMAKNTDIKLQAGGVTKVSDSL